MPALVHRMTGDELLEGDRRRLGIRGQRVGGTAGQDHEVAGYTVPFRRVTASTSLSVSVMRSRLYDQT